MHDEIRALHTDIHSPSVDLDGVTWNSSASSTKITSIRSYRPMLFNIAPLLAYRRVINCRLSLRLVPNPFRTI